MENYSLLKLNKSTAAILLSVSLVLIVWNSTKFKKIAPNIAKAGEIFINTTNRNRSRVHKTKVRAKKKLSMLERALRNATANYTILVWEPPFGNKIPLHVGSSRCGTCEISYDQKKVSDPTTKAVIFHFNELENIAKLPKTRRKDQLYLWWTMEAAPALRSIHGQTLAQYDAIFNLTMSHRRDSDVYIPYGSAVGMLWNFKRKGSGNPVKDINVLVAKKSKLALWIVSNCAKTVGAVKRLAYSNALVNAGLNLERKGACFPKNGPVESLKIAKDYKFYLAFENAAHCTDYITEKVFQNALLMDTVPIVMGARRQDYAALLPPGSYIYADDFGLPTKLVEYLNYLDKNDTAYKDYFKWRTLNKEDMPQYNRTYGFCQICRILHGINVDNLFNPNYKELYSGIPLFGHPKTARIVPSLREWFYGTETKRCLPHY